VQTAAPTLVTGAAAAVCVVLSTVREGKDVGARWATPSTPLPAVSMPEASQKAIAGGAASAAGGGLARGVVLVTPASPVAVVAGDCPIHAFPR
jgi:hypothetical protein